MSGMQPVDDGDPGDVQRWRRVGHTPSADSVGLLDEGDGPPRVVQPAPQDAEINGVNPAARAMTERHETPTTPRQHRPCRPGGGVDRERARERAVFTGFLAEVAYAQLADWLPTAPQTILDLSPGCPRLVGLMVEKGHTVIHAVAHREPSPVPRHDRLWWLRADGRSLDWLADASVDVVVAEGSALSAAPAAESTLDEVHGVLRPGGRLLLCVDSLVAGLSRLADQGRWAELADVPAADVVLVPENDGSVTRCFWPEELHAMLADIGFDVEWIRPRTVLAEETVTTALTADPGRMASLVATELALAVRRQGESIGGQLVASARRL